ncbi:MAG TPA: hypothetical protein VKZ49_07855 [Polyangiaceae bacterium]|nr:hypothetical protein [Polyangiaceae bacterium]
MVNGAVYLVAALLAVFYTVRKLDVQRRLPEQFAHVDRRAFLSWQRSEQFGFNLATLACVAMIVLDRAWLYAAGQYALSGSLVRGVGAGLFFGWIIALIAAARLRARARREREALGIVLGPRTAGEGTPSAGQ